MTESTDQIFLNAAQTFKIGPHSDLKEPILPKDVIIEARGKARVAVTNCPHCGLRFETYHFRETWYQV